MSRDRFPRREFLLRALAACAAPVLVGRAAGQMAQGPAPAAAARRGRVTAAYLGAGSLEAARAIAEAYIAHSALERNDEAFVDAASATVDIISRAGSDASAIAALVTRVRSDFVADRVIQLEGWVFSRTELDLCLLTLLPTG
jgi:hypothetical protein